MKADDAAAENGYFSGKHARNAAEQHAAAAIGLLQRGCAGLDRQPSGHLRHRSQQRQSAAVVGHGLIGNRGDAGRKQAFGLLRIRSKVQVGVEDLAVAQLHPFVGLRLLDLDDHVRLGEHVLGGPGDRCACSTVGVVVGADTGAGARLDQNLMAVGGVFADGARRQADAIFVVLDFLGAADAHLAISVLFRA